MQKKLLAVAVAGALAAPGVALAQSSVTISGFFKVSVENIAIRSFGGTAGTFAVAAPPAAGRRAGDNSSEGRLADDSSRIVFNVVEDLGGGMQAVAQADMRINSANYSTGVPPMTGNTHVGLKSKSWGQLRVGMQDLHYGGRESYLTDKGDLRADSISLMSFVAAGFGAIASASRTPNVIFYDTPALWGGFTFRAAYSFSPFSNSINSLSGVTNAGGVTTGAAGQPSITSNDIGSNARRGRAWNFNPNYAAGPLVIGYSYWSAKLDNPNGFTPGAISAAGVASADQRSDRLYGSYTWGGFRVGLAWDKSKLTAQQSTGGTIATTPAAIAAESTAAGAALTTAGNAAGATLTALGVTQAATGTAGAAAFTGTRFSNRTAWSLPLSYTWGAHEIHAHFTKARADRGAAFTGLDTKANMFAASYQYSFSKRTSLALTYAQINNGAAAQYNFFTSTSLGSADAGLKAGEDPRLWAATIRHAF